MQRLLILLAMVGIFLPVGHGQTQPSKSTNWLQNARLLRKFAPVYPAEAKAHHVEGTVALEVNVDKEGNVTDVKMLSGPGMLKDSAIQAVKLWKYSPALLNGRPVPCTMTVSVPFQLK